MYKFKQISSIGKSHCKRPISVESHIYLSFDIDWCNNEVLEDTIDLIEPYQIAATWYVTHKTSLIDKIRRNHNFELGIHPNFNFLIDGDDRVGSNAEEVVENLMKIVPEAKSVRSHSLTTNSRLLDLFASKGLSHECNYFIPEQCNFPIYPWQIDNDMIRVPHFWADDYACLHKNNSTASKLLTRTGLKVFDFHPIHVFLNTEHPNRYNKTRSLHNHPDELIKHRYEGYGIRNQLVELLELSRENENRNYWKNRNAL